jgi:capsular polysaccharide biosynthesis protein
MLAAIRRNRGLVAAVALLVTGVVTAIAVASPPRFQARARIAADMPPSGAFDTTAVDRGLASSRVLITAPRVLGEAARRLPGESAATLASKVSAQVDSTAAMVDVLATDEDPRRAARIANGVATTFLRLRAAAERRSAERLRSGLRAELEAMSQRDAAGPLGDALRQRISDVAVAAIAAGSSLSLAEPATPPAEPYAPRPLRNGLLAAIAGLLLGALAAIARERLRPGSPDPRALAREAGQPLLAVVPHGRSPRPWRRGNGGDAAPIGIAEATLQGSLKAALPPDRARIILVCGVAPGDAHERVADGLVRALSWAGSTAARLSWQNGHTGRDDLDAALPDGHGYLILDVPSVTESPDLQIVSRQLDGALLAAGAGRATAADITVATELLRALKVHVLGVVVTAPADAMGAHTAGAFEPAARPPARRPPRPAPVNGTVPAAPAPPRAAPPPPPAAPPPPDAPPATAGSVSLWTRNASAKARAVQQIPS